MGATIKDLRGSFLWLNLIALVLLSPACKKSSYKPDKLGIENIPINKWVAENMRIYYYWNEDIPVDNRLTFELTPPKFFETLRNKDDRFSWIQNAEELKDQLSG